MSKLWARNVPMFNHVVCSSLVMFWRDYIFHVELTACESASPSRSTRSYAAMSWCEKLSWRTWVCCTGCEGVILFLNNCAVYALTQCSFHDETLLSALWGAVAIWCTCAISGRAAKCFGETALEVSKLTFRCKPNTKILVQSPMTRLVTSRRENAVANACLVTCAFQVHLIVSVPASACQF